VHFQKLVLQNHFELLSNPLQKKEPPTQNQSVGGKAPMDYFSQRKMGETGNMGWRERKNKNKNKNNSVVRRSREGGALAVWVV
jgi:hypothetical protein